MGSGVRLAADRDLTWLLDSGEDARGRYGSAGGVQDGETGEDGDGSVDRRMVGGFFKKSSSGGLSSAGPGTLMLGTGEGRNSSILFASGTGSMLTEVALYTAYALHSGYAGLITGRRAAYAMRFDGGWVRGRGETPAADQRRASSHGKRGAFAEQIAKRQAGGIGLWFCPAGESRTGGRRCGWDNPAILRVEYSRGPNRSLVALSRCRDDHTDGEASRTRFCRGSLELEPDLW